MLIQLKFRILSQINAETDLKCTLSMTKFEQIDVYLLFILAQII